MDASEGDREVQVPFSLMRNQSPGKGGDPSRPQSSEMGVGMWPGGLTLVLWLSPLLQAGHDHESQGWQQLHWAKPGSGVL